MIEQHKLRVEYQELAGNISPLLELKSAVAMARALTQNFPAEEQLEMAREFGRQLVAGWWRALTIQEIVPQELREPLESIGSVELPEAAVELAARLGGLASKVDIEVAAYNIGLAYTGMLPDEHRSNYGIYYTPPQLTARLLDQISEAGIDWSKCRVLDPACGGGAFLAPLARRIIQELDGCSPKLLMQSIGNRLRGFEIDPFAAWLSQVTLDAVMLPVSRLAKKKLPVMVTVCDSLRRAPPKDRFDLVIGNPPYGRAKLDADTRERYQRSLYGHANLYGIFTDLALRYTKVGGLISYVTPTSFLAGVYFKNLRALLGRYANPISIDFVEGRKGVFDDVLQETALTTYRKGDRKGKTLVCRIEPSAEGVKVCKAGEISLPDDPSLPWLLPRAPEQAALVQRLTSLPFRLQDWGYSVSTGQLVWNRHKSQLSHRPSAKRLPLIWAEAITSDGKFVFRADKKNHAPYFELKPGDDWLITKKSCVLLQRTTAKEQSRRLISAVLPGDFITKYGGVVVENHINMLRPIVDSPVVSADVLSAFINSDAADRAFRCVSGSVAVSAYELESLPLPDPARLGELVDLVMTNAGNKAIDTACARLFSED